MIFSRISIPKDKMGVFGRFNEVTAQFSPVTDGLSLVADGLSAVINGLLLMRKQFPLTFLN